MCGLVGVLDTRGDARRLADNLQRATDALVHRGPDDQGHFFDGPVGLGFRRLSILDLTPAGHQPMTSADGNWTIVFNGEIYNFIELRRDLEAVGAQFRSESDTEVLVEGLARWGLSILDTCNGMWALLAWHAPEQTLYACRDPWGIKPLYVAEDHGRVVLASEIGALRAFGSDLGDVDRRLLRHFIAEGDLDVTPQSIYQRVHRLQPGFITAYRVGQPARTWAYADGTRLPNVPWYSDRPGSEAEYVEAFRAAYIRSVELRLRADVPVGTCMSGGLDSTSITCTAARILASERTRPCRYAFTALLSEFDESEYIRAVIAQTGAEWHFTVCSDAQVSDNIDRFIAVHDEPVHSLSAFAGYLVMSLAAAAGVKVLLNGQGADELLAGYPSTALPYVRTIAREEGMLAAFRAARAEFDRPRDLASSVVRAGAGLAMATLPEGVQHRLQRMRRPSGALPLLPLESPSTFSSEPLATTYLRHNLLDQQFRAPLPLYLRIEDVNSSAFSLESRLPFLDPALVALAREAPANLLRREGWNKYLLRESMRGLLPEAVRQRRDKMGFPIPSERWWRGPLAERVPAIMDPRRLQARELYDVPAVTAELRAFQAGKPLAPWLGRVLLVELWAAHHLDRAA